MLSQNFEVQVESPLELLPLFQTDAVVAACRNRLIQYIFASGLTMRGASAKFEKFASPLYTDFLENAFDSLLLQGFLTWNVAKVQREKVPVVVPHNRCSVRLKVHESMRVELLTEPKFRVFVVNWPDSSTGRLRSRVSEIRRWSEWTNGMLELGAAVEAQRAEAAVVRKPAHAASDVVHNFSQVTTAEMLMGDDSMDPIYQQLKREELKQVRQKVDERQLPQGPIEGTKRRKLNDWLYAEEGYDFTRMNVGTGSTTHFSELEERRSTYVALVMGVPLTALGMHSSQSTIALAGSQGVFRDTVMYWRRLLVDLVTQVHQEIYGEDDGISFSLNGIPITNSLEDLELLRTSGVITGDRFRELIMLAFGLDPRTEPRPDKLDLEAESEALDVETKRVDIKARNQEMKQQPR